MSDHAEKFCPLGNGQAACAGCTINQTIEPVVSAAPQPKQVIAVGASGCSIVAQYIYPLTAWKINFTHVIFETTGGAMTGMEAAYKALKNKGRLPPGADDVRVLGIAGDGATADIGLGSLLGWCERGDPGLYLCYDNNGYQNTGTQSSGTSPKGSHTTTTPHGYQTSPKAQGKDLIKLVLCQPAVTYAAMTTLSTLWPHDLEYKAEAAFEAAKHGPAFLHCISPCPRGWGYPADQARIIGDIGIETGVIPLYHVIKVGDEHIWYLDFLPERYKEYWNGGEIQKDIHPIGNGSEANCGSKTCSQIPQKLPDIKRTSTVNGKT